MSQPSEASQFHPGAVGRQPVHRQVGTAVVLEPDLALAVAEVESVYRIARVVVHHELRLRCWQPAVNDHDTEMALLGILGSAIRQADQFPRPQHTPQATVSQHLLGKVGFRRQTPVQCGVQDRDAVQAARTTRDVTAHRCGGTHGIPCRSTGGPISSAVS